MVKYLVLTVTGCLTLFFGQAVAQSPPSPVQIAAYDGLHRAAYLNDLDAIRRLAASGANLEARDGSGRTPLHVAAFQSHEAAAAALVKAGADANALEHQDYDIVTIAAVADDVPMLKQALALGNRPGNITSPYEGTALIAAAHLGHVEVVKILISAGAPLDHVNNLHWTALIESVVLGDGGPAHVAVARALIEAGADVSLTDREGLTPLELAKRRGYVEMVKLFGE